MNICSPSLLLTAPEAKTTNKNGCPLELCSWTLAMYSTVDCSSSSTRPPRSARNRHPSASAGNRHRERPASEVRQLRCAGAALRCSSGVPWAFRPTSRIPLQMPFGRASVRIRPQRFFLFHVTTGFYLRLGAGRGERECHGRCACGNVTPDERGGHTLFGWLGWVWAMKCHSL